MNDDVPTPYPDDAEAAAPSPGVTPDEITGRPGPDDGGVEATDDQETDGDRAENTIESPAKVLRIGSMIKQLLDEVKAAPIDEASRERMADVFETSVRELAKGLSPDLRRELDALVLPFESEAPSEAELRIAHAQLVGWLEGLFHGIQATLMAQQAEARNQLEEMRRRGLPQGGRGPSEGQQHNGTYL